MDNKKPLHSAMDAALLSMTEVYARLEATAEGRDQTSDERIAELAAKIWSGLDANTTQETDIGDVALPYYVVATLLLGIKELQFDNFHLESQHSPVYKPPPTKREINRVRNRAMLYEYERLLKSGHDKEDAVQQLADKYKAGSVDAMRRAISRSLADLNKYLESEGKPPSPTKLPWNRE